jgi:spore germination protein
MKHINIAIPRVSSRALAAMMAALALAGLIAAGARTRQYNESKNTLSGIYQKAFYETCELTESMAVNLSKLSVASGGARENLLSDIIRQAQGAQANLALLPLSSSATSATMKFINQVGDFSDRLLSRLAMDGDITGDDYSTITTLSESAAALTLSFGRLLERYDAGQIIMEDILVDDADLSPITDPASSYPSLLYDGPFSDGAKGDVFKNLEGLSEVSSDDAARLLKEFVGADQVTDMRLDGESTLPTPTYEFSLTAAGRSISAGVTKTGGKILYMLCSDEISGQALTVNQCIERADAFLLSRGYGDMVMSYHAQYGGIVTINYAAQQAGVIMYPDLIKVQVSMEDGAVVGIEAGNYLLNHTDRFLELPALTEADAVARLSAHLTAESARLCVIPYGTSEKLCYEINAASGSDAYLIYIDAMTGEEAEIMQIVSDEGGVLVM